VVKKIEESEANEEQQTVESSTKEWEVQYGPSSSNVWIDIISVIYAHVCVIYVDMHYI